VARSARDGSIPSGLHQPSLWFRAKVVAHSNAGEDIVATGALTPASSYGWQAIQLAYGSLRAGTIASGPPPSASNIE